MINRKRVDASAEKKILIGMIVDDGFLRDIRVIADVELFASPYVRTVAEWCLEYFERYSKAPAAAMQDLYDRKARSGKVPEGERVPIEEFLKDLDEEHRADDHFNAEFWLDEAEAYFEARTMKMTAEDVQALVSVGNLGAAREVLMDFRPVKRPTSHVIDLTNCDDLYDRAFDAAAESLFELPGAIGKLLNPLFVRESLVGFMAPEKRGKTWLMQELTKQAAVSGCNVAFWAVGDMTETQMARRFAVGLTRRNYLKHECGLSLVPVYDCFFNQNNSCTLDTRASRSGIMGDDDIAKALTREGGKKSDAFYAVAAKGYKPCHACMRDNPRGFRGAVWWDEFQVEPLNKEGAKRASRQFRERYGDRIRLFTYEARELTPDRIDRDMQMLADDDFVVDVGVVDYADNMDCDERVEQERHRQNNIWLGLNALRKRWHACFLTPTQTDARAYTQTSINMTNFNEDKRKLSHCTAMVGMNQTEEEKADGILRLGLVVAREQEFGVMHQVRVLQHLKSGRPIMGSF